MAEDPIMEMYEETEEPIHLWFNLTYSNYLVLHRSLMQSMDVEWQRRMVKCLVELERAFEHIDRADLYHVQPRDRETGRFISDPVPHYNRGRTYIEPHGFVLDG